MTHGYSSRCWTNSRTKQGEHYWIISSYLKLTLSSAPDSSSNKHCNIYVIHIMYILKKNNFQNKKYFLHKNFCSKTHAFVYKQYLCVFKILLHILSRPLLWLTLMKTNKPLQCKGAYKSTLNNLISQFIVIGSNVLKPNNKKS